MNPNGLQLGADYELNKMIMITKNEIIELLKEYSGYIDRSRTEQAIHEDNFDIVSDAILSKLRQDAVIKNEVTVCGNEWHESNMQHFGKCHACGLKVEL